MNQEKDDRFPRYGKWKQWIDKQHIAVRWSYKSLVAVIGIAIIIVGLILIPLPGPGWLIVFAGLAFLGLEFPFIHRFNSHVRDRVKTLWRKIRGRNVRKHSAPEENSTE